MGRNKSLRSKFLSQILTVLFFISFCTSVLEVYLINEQIKNNIDNQSSLVSQQIKHSLYGTQLASKEIEHQIDLKLEAQSRHIADFFKGRSLDSITNEELVKIRDKFNLSGITIFTPIKDDVVAVKATDSNEIGFSLKKANPFGLKAMQEIMNGQIPDLKGMGYVKKNLMILPIVQSASHGDKPTFFKYAYYYLEGTNFAINPYIQADQVYQYTEKVGPNQQIKEILKGNKNIKEIAVLNPKVYENPVLAKNYFPPMKKIVYGHFQFETKRDIEVLKGMAKNLKTETYVQEIDNKKLYKMFIPISEHDVIYIALDSDRMSKPLYRQSTIFIVSSLLALVILSLLTASFFNKIYERIQIIKKQVKRLEDGDFTAISNVKDGTELQALSESANRMVATLQYTLKDTANKAEDVQRLADMLEEEASHSVEKIFTLSTEATIKSRDQLDDIMSFLDLMEEYVKQNEDEKTNALLKEIELIRQVANERAADTTEMTISLSDLIQSLHQQSTELSNIATKLSHSMNQFKL